MRIGIDAHTIGYKVSGNQTYVRNLIENLARIDQENQYYLYFTNPEMITDGRFRFKNFQKKLIRPETPWLRVPLGFPLQLTKAPVDLLHVQYVAPPYCPCDFVVTIHDISFKLFPEYYTKAAQWWTSILIPFTARRAKKIFTVSEYSKNDLITHYNIPEEKIVVTPDPLFPNFSLSI